MWLIIIIPLFVLIFIPVLAFLSTMVGWFWAWVIMIGFVVITIGKHSAGDQ